VEEPGFEGVELAEGEADALALTLAEADADAETEAEAEVGVAQAPPPIELVVLVPAMTHNELSALFFLTTRFAFGFLNSGEGPRA
jgi:hypothetical protein